MQVEIAQGSLTDGDESVLVNASNTRVLLGSGVSAAIALACGGDAYQTKISAALKAKYGGAMMPGQVLVTDAGTHPRAKYVVHAAIIGGARPTLDTARTAYEAIWDAVENLPDAKRSVAMVALGAGVGGLDLADSVRVACETLKAWTAIHQNGRIDRVAFYGYSAREFQIVSDVVKKHFPAARQRG